jgi:hypothetical protein
MKDFYLTLTSNSSMEYYTDNKTSHFTVKLPKILTLTGKWAVALAEIHYPNTFYNVSLENNTIFFKWRVGKFFDRNEIEVNNYDSIEDLIKTINDCVYTRHIEKTHSINAEKNGEEEHKNSLIKYDKDEKVYMLQLDEEKNRIFINAAYKKTYCEIAFQNRLGLILGYEPNQNAITLADNKVRKPHLWYGIPDEIMVYIDIIEPQVIAHEMAKIIRIVTVDKTAKYEETTHKEFKRLQYFPLLKKEFDNISVELRDRTGQYLPFQYGNATLVLHFIKLE